MPQPSPFAPSTTSARANGTEQPAIGASTEMGGGGVSTAPAALAIPQRKESGLAKAQADKKKLDARKKSLKRL